jgi:hypothetical protein
LARWCEDETKDEDEEEAGHSETLHAETAQYPK